MIQTGSDPKSDRMRNWIEFDTTSSNVTDRIRIEFDPDPIGLDPDRIGLDPDPIRLDPDRIGSDWTRSGSVTLLLVGSLRL